MYGEFTFTRDHWHDVSGGQPAMTTPLPNSKRGFISEKDLVDSDLNESN